MDNLPITPQIPSPQLPKNPWVRACIYEGVIIIILLSFCGLQNFSLKKVKEELKTVKSTHSQGITITKWQNIAGKAYPVTIISTVRDTLDTSDHKKDVTIWKSGISAGTLVSIRTLDPAIYGVQDLVPLGPGTIQGAEFFIPGTGELYLGAGYRLLF